MVRVNISMDDGELKELDKLAGEAGMNRSEFIVMMSKAMGHIERNDFKAMTEFVFKTLGDTLKKKVLKK